MGPNLAIFEAGEIMTGKQNLIIFMGVGLMAYRFFTSSQRTQITKFASGLKSPASTPPPANKTTSTITSFKMGTGATVN